MASIDRMQLRGVRSFNPETEDEWIEFYKPITIIVGQNGCGKTTIIECIKYALTGAFPPGCAGAGCGRQAFVHDCKAVQQKKVKARVKLRFTAHNKQQAIAVRSMEVEQKNVTQTFKQNDGELRTLNPDNTKKTVPFRNTELDKRVSEMLGVSKAVLENVIFCHQEDSSWPLMAPAAVKKNLESILDSEKHSKRKQNLVDEGKDCEKRVRALERDFYLLNAQKEEADRIRADVIAKRASLETLEQSRTDVERQIDECEARIGSLSAVVENVKFINKQIEAHQKESRSIETRIESLRAHVKKDLTTEFGLEQLIAMHDQHIILYENNAHRVSVAQLEDAIRSGHARHKGLTQKLEGLTFEKQSYEQIVLQRASKMESILQNPVLGRLVQKTPNCEFAKLMEELRSLSQSQGPSSATAPSSIADSLKRFSSAVEERLLASRANSKLADATELRAEILGIDKTIVKTENDMQKLEVEKTVVEENLRDLNASLGKKYSQFDVGKLPSLENEKDRLKKEGDDLEKECLRIETEMQRADSESVLAELQKRKDELLRINESLEEVQPDESGCKEALDSLEKGLRAASCSLAKCDIQWPVSLAADSDDEGAQIVESIAAIAEKFRRKHKVAEGQLSKVSRNLMEERKLVSKKKVLVESSEESLVETKKKLRAASKNAEKVKRRIEVLRKDEPALRSPTTPSELLRAINNRVEALIQKKESVNGSLLNELKQLREAVIDALIDLFDCDRLKSDTTSLEARVKQLNEEISVSFKKCQKLEAGMNQQQAEVAEFGRLVELARGWSDKANIFAERKTSIKAKKTEICDTFGISSCPDSTSIQRQLSDNLQRLVKVNRNSSKMEESISAIRALMLQNSRARQSIMEQVSTTEKKKGILSRRELLQDRLEQINGEVSKCRSNLDSHKEKKEETEKRCEKISKSTDDDDDDDDEIFLKWNAISTVVGELISLQKEIDEYEMSSKPQDFQSITSEVATVDAENKNNQEQLEKRRALLDCENARDFEILLSANIEISTGTKSREGMEEKIENLKKDLAKIGGSATAAQDLAVRKSRLDALRKKLSRFDGQHEERSRHINGLELLLQDDRFNNVNERCSECQIKLSTARRLQTEFSVCATSLQAAITEFHTVKLKEINSLVRELWYLAYKHQDPTRIEIKDDYSVAMTKEGGAKMNMRGRCSAGQRVLASIVIRLALAETFAVHFGCIALDEPTVNLDFANKKGLALALAQIVSNRATRNDNFQLVLITHDTDFVKILKSELNSNTGFTLPAHQFEVVREENKSDGKLYSKIKQVDWDPIL